MKNGGSLKKEEALEQIRYIRDTMNKASDRMFFSPWQWIEWGVLVLIAGIATDWLIKNNQNHFILYLWIIVFIVGGTLETIIWVREAQNRGVEPFNPFLMKLWIVGLGIFLIPIVFTPIFLQINMPMYIPGLWLVSTGVAMFSMVLLSVRKEVLVFCEVLLISGILSVSLFLEYSLQILTFSFGLGALIVGIFLLLTKKKTRVHS